MTTMDVHQKLSPPHFSSLCRTNWEDDPEGAEIRNMTPSSSNIPSMEGCLTRDGFLHLSKVLVKNECDSAVERIWDFLEDTSSSGCVDRHNAVTWSQSASFSSASSSPTSTTRADGKGIAIKFENFGAGWLLGSVRELLADRVFEPLYGTKELHSSKEGFELLFPEERTWIGGRGTELRSAGPAWTAGSPPPSAGSPASPKDCSDPKRCWRALTVLSSGVLSGSGSDTKSLPLTLVDALARRSRELLLCTGDVLIFPSDVRIEMQFPTQSKPNLDDPDLSTTSFFHVPTIMYCTMQRAVDLSKNKKLWNKKIEAYKQRQTSDFHAYGEVWSAPCIRQNTRCYFRTGPPLVSPRLAELYGLIPYHSGDWKREVDRAVIRGVRFVDETDHDGNGVVPITVLPPNVQPPCTVGSVQLTSHDQQLLSGQDKYLGGMAAGGYIYGVPGTARRVLKISVASGEMECIGPEFAGKFKWLRGVDIPPSEAYPEGCCIALPCNHLSFLKVVPFDAISGKSDQVYAITTPLLRDECADIPGWYYHGGNLASNGWIYCIPANASRVSKIHPLTDEVRFLGPTFDGRQKWYGGIVGSDGCIYGIPHNAQAVLKIDPTSDAVTLLRGTHHPLHEGSWKWHGGLRAGHKIIGFPNNSDHVLVIDCERSTVYTIGDANILQSGRHRIPQDGRYKYLGGALTSDGRFAYLFPCDAERVLRMDIDSDQLTLVGPSLLDGENKYQNGFCGSDGCLYGIPQRAMGVLRISPPQVGLGNEEETIDIISCGENMVGTVDKFEGGVMGPDDCIYCIPLRARACVKIIPGFLPTK